MSPIAALGSTPRTLYGSLAAARAVLDEWKACCGQEWSRRQRSELDAERSLRSREPAARPLVKVGGPCNSPDGSNTTRRHRVEQPRGPSCIEEKEERTFCEGAADRAACCGGEWTRRPPSGAAEPYDLPEGGVELEAFAEGLRARRARAGAWTTAERTDMARLWWLQKGERPRESGG